MTDKLTGLFTDKDFPAAREVLHGRDAEAVLVDIAGLIWENDQFGHEHADATICTIARLLSQTAELRGGLVYRFGGDEFLLLLPDVTHDDALHVARSVVASVAALELAYRRLDHPRDFVAVNAVVTRLEPNHLADAAVLREYLADKVHEATLSEGRSYNLVVDSRGAADGRAAVL